MKRTSRSIVRRHNRLDGLDSLKDPLDPRARIARGQLLAGFLTHDAKRHGLEMGFRADASGQVHIYSRNPMLDDAIKRGHISKRQFPDCFTTRFLSEMIRLNGPNLHKLEEVTQRLQRSKNSEVRASLRRRDKTKRGFAEAAERRKVEKRRDRATDMLRTIYGPDWKPSWGPLWGDVRIDCDADNWRNNPRPFSLVPPKE
jgi:hypothetical protein